MRSNTIVHGVVLALLLAAAAPLLSGCNTVAGAGQDVSHAGNAVTRGAQDAKKGM